MKKHIPNIITLVNLFCGCLALPFAFSGDYIPVFWLLTAGGVADYMDGLIARGLKVYSTLGKELDSLADMVSFGVVPGVILYRLLLEGQGAAAETSAFFLPAAPAFLLTVFAGYRLGKFNIDTRQVDHFIGLPTPACTVFVAGLLMIFEFNSFGMRAWVSNPYFLYSCTLLLSVLLISEVPMFNLKFKNLQWAGNEIRIIFLVTAVLLLIIFREMAFSIIISLYILLSLFRYWFQTGNQ